MSSKKVLIFLFANLAVASGFFIAVPASADGTEKVLHSFGAGKDGTSPRAGLIFDASGNLYGTTYGGGVFKSGTVFSLTRRASGKWRDKVLHSFGNGKDGATPSAGLIFDGAGNLYGTTSAGGAQNKGTVFELTPGGNGQWTEKILHSFGKGKDGANPHAGLVFDSAGSLYGTTEQGGNECNPPVSCGTVFELSPGGDGKWSENVLYRFCSVSGCADGSYPEAGLTLDAAGNLYGTTSAGGPGGVFGGFVFELIPGKNGKWTETLLYTFCSISNCTDGAFPLAGLIFDSAGNLYGTTAVGGDSSCGVRGCGTVFRLAPGGNGHWTENVLHSFHGGTDGAGPYDAVIFDAAASLYGTTISDSHNMGTVFKLGQVNGQWINTVLFNFKSWKGSYPYDGVTFDGVGNLYGTTAGGGANSGGTVFEIPK